MGGFLIGLSTFQAEFDFGVPQFDQIFQPMLIALAAGIALTSEQEAAADNLHHKYVGQLRVLNRDIQALHNRLISLEADKLFEIEKILTKDQLAELRRERMSATTSPKLSASDKESTTE
jgi:hypothetical protein